MKKIDIRSLLIGALLGATIVLSIAAATATSTGSRIVCEYRVVTGSVFQQELEKAINSSVAEGWDFVSASGPNEGNWGFAVLKREKK
jgi:hypothetical protein